MCGQEHSGGAGVGTHAAEEAGYDLFNMAAGNALDVEVIYTMGSASTFTDT